MAQNSLLGVIASCLPAESQEGVLVQGSRTPLVDLVEGLDWVAWAYVDDFGVLGLSRNGLPPAEGVVRVLYYRIRAKFVEFGFRVHKEGFGAAITSLGLRIGHLDENLKAPPGDGATRTAAGVDEQAQLPRQQRVLLRPTEERRADMVFGTEALLLMEEVPVTWVHTVLRIWTYYMLIRRASLSIFRDTYRYVEDYDENHLCRLGIACGVPR